MQYRALRRLFSNLASNHFGTHEISVICRSPQPLVAGRTAGCREWQWCRKAPMPFSCADCGALDVCSKLPESGSKSSFWAGTLSLPRRMPHNGSQGRTRGTFMQEAYRMDTTSRRNRMCAFTACVRFLRLPRPRRAAQPIKPGKDAKCNCQNKNRTSRAGTVIAVPALFL